MWRKRSRNIFIAAFALSLLLHLLLAGWAPWPFMPQPEEQPYTRVRLLPVIKRPRRTPPPTPAPTPQVTPRVRSSIRPPVVTTHTGPPSHHAGPIPIVQPSVKVLPTPVPTARSLPTPVPGPCGGHANAEPTVAATPDTPDIPPDARASKVTGTAAILVQLDARAQVTGAAIAQTSGSTGLDAVALQMAKAATYTPRYVNCKAIAGTYTFTVHFWTW